MKKYVQFSMQIYIFEEQDVVRTSLFGDGGDVGDGRVDGSIFGDLFG